VQFRVTIGTQFFRVLKRSRSIYAGGITIPYPNIRWKIPKKGAEWRSKFNEERKHTERQPDRPGTLFLADTPLRVAARADHPFAGWLAFVLSLSNRLHPLGEKKLFLGGGVYAQNDAISIERAFIKACFKLLEDFNISYIAAGRRRLWCRVLLLQADESRGLGCRKPL